MICESVHPLRPDMFCDKETPCTGYHANAGHGLVWPHEKGLPSVSPPPQKKGAATRKVQLVQIARRAQR
jgi:hypothetical protein